MSNELIINSTQNGDRIALLKDKKLVELHYQNEEKKLKVGDIYLGTVRKLVPGLNAAFIDIGFEKDAFLNYPDLGANVNSLMKFTRQVQGNTKVNHKLSGFEMLAQTDKRGKISDVLKPNYRILVQVTKEPISTKGPRLSSELSIPGRYLVLLPFSNDINVSTKITASSERKRLLRLVSSIKPNNFGVIIRTLAEDKEVAELDKELRSLVLKWTKGLEILAHARPKQKVIGEINKASSLLRDMLNESFDSIVVDSQQTYEEIKTFVKDIVPEKEKILRHYNSRIKIFENFGIEKQLKTLFGKAVTLPNGGYLVIEHTEALHVIDVNSGNKSNKEDSQEVTALKVNLEAGEEIARQLRLRDMGGIIVVDFIDMREAENRKKLYNFIKAEMKKDRTKSNVLPLSKFGLMQITRQRVKPTLNINTQESCPSCNGTGKIMASIAVSDQIENNLDYILKKQNALNLTLIVHPYLYSFFTKGLISPRIKWFFKYYRWVKLIKDSSLGIREYRFINKQNEQIQIQ